MSTPVLITIIGLVGTLLFMLLAWWVWQRGREAGRLEAEREQADPHTHTAHIAAPKPAPSDATGTVAIPPPREAAGTVAISASTAKAIAKALPAPEPEPKPEPTEFMPMPEPEPESTQFMPAPEPKPEATQFMARMPAPAKPVASMSTETISRDELQSLIDQHRRVAAPAPAPAPAPPSPAMPTPTPHSGIAKLEPRVEAPRSGPPDIPLDTLREHFEAALAACERVFGAGERDLAALVEGPESAWRKHVDVLALTGARSLEALVLPSVREAGAALVRRRAAAALALELEQAKGHDALRQLLGSLDAEGRAACMWALARSSSERVDALVRAELASAAARDRMDWLQVLEQRGADPGPLVAELLDAKEPVEQAWALRMLVVHERGQALIGKADRHVMMGPPNLRMAALRATLAYQRPAAWTQCKAAARDPSLPEACLLVAMLGSAADVKDLASWSSKPSAPPHAGWALGVSGRAVGMAACIERLEHADAAVAASALAGLRHATGYAGADSPAEVRTWWASARERFAEDRRHLGGEPFTLGSIRAALAGAGETTRAALRLELQVRSPGKPALPAVAWPSRERALLDSLASLDIDLARCWGSN